MATNGYGDCRPSFSHSHRFLCVPWLRGYFIYKVLLCFRPLNALQLTGLTPKKVVRFYCLRRNVCREWRCCAPCREYIGLCDFLLVGMVFFLLVAVVIRGWPSIGDKDCTPVDFYLWFFTSLIILFVLFLYSPPFIISFFSRPKNISLLRINISLLYFFHLDLQVIPCVCV